MKKRSYIESTWHKFLSEKEESEKEEEVWAEDLFKIAKKTTTDCILFEGKGSKIFLQSTTLGPQVFHLVSYCSKMGN